MNWTLVAIAVNRRELNFIWTSLTLYSSGWPQRKTKATWFFLLLIFKNLASHLPLTFCIAIPITNGSLGQANHKNRLGLQNQAPEGPQRHLYHTRCFLFLDGVHYASRRCIIVFHWCNMVSNFDFIMAPSWYHEENILCLMMGIIVPL